MTVSGLDSDTALPTRLFYTACITFLGGVFVGTFLAVTWPTLVWIMLLAVVLALLWRRSGAAQSAHVWLYLAIALVCFVLGAARVGYVLEAPPSPLAELVGTKVVLEGMVVREPEQRATTKQLFVRTTEDTVLVSVDRYASVAYGDSVTVSGTLKIPEAFTTDLGRTFNYPGYLQAKGVQYQISFAELSVSEENSGNPVLAALFGFKQSLMTKIEESLPEPMAGLGEGLLLGVKQSLGEELEADFRRTGIIHIVVLSGYNVMLIVAFVLYALSYVLPLRPRIAVGIVAITLFALMVGLSATVVRASIMASILLIAQALGRQYLVLRGLLLAGVVMIVSNPLLLVYDIGFQLSFMATLGLILVAPLLERLITTPVWSTPIMTFFYATLATQLTVLPLLLYHIGELSLIAVVVNVLVLPMVPIAMFLTFMVSVFGFLSSSLATLIAAPTYLSLAYIIEVAKWFSALPFAALTVPAFPFWLVGVAYGLTGVVLWRYRHLWLGFGQAELGERLVANSLKSKEQLSVGGWTIEVETDDSEKAEAARVVTSTLSSPTYKNN